MGMSNPTGQFVSKSSGGDVIEVYRIKKKMEMSNKDQFQTPVFP